MIVSYQTDEFKLLSAQNTRALDSGQFEIESTDLYNSVFFVGLTIARCPSPAPRLTNRTRSWFTSCCVTRLSVLWPHHFRLPNTRALVRHLSIGLFKFESTCTTVFSSLLAGQDILLGTAPHPMNRMCWMISAVTSSPFQVTTLQYSFFKFICLERELMKKIGTINYALIE